MQQNSNEKRSLVVSVSNKSGGYDTLNTITNVSNDSFKLDSLNKTNNNVGRSVKQQEEDEGKFSKYFANNFIF